MIMQAKKTTRRERQAELLKKEILEAALVVFKEYGYEKATTKKIAEKAEVSEGTLYNYFENKHDILISLFKIIQERTSNNLKNLPDYTNDINKLLSARLVSQLDPNSTLSIFTLLLHEADRDPDVQKIFQEQVKAIRKSRIDFFKQLENTGKIRKVNTTIMAMLINTITFGYITMIESGDKELARIPINKLANEIADILANGLTAPAKTKSSMVFENEILKN
jgi:AcrR family transcriptional regulator